MDPHQLPDQLWRDPSTSTSSRTNSGGRLPSAREYQLEASYRVTKIGLSKVDACADMTESPSTIAEALLVPKAAIWSTMVMHTYPFTDDMLQNVQPYHEVLLARKPHMSSMATSTTTSS